MKAVFPPLCVLSTFVKIQGLQLCGLVSGHSSSSLFGIISGLYSFKFYGRFDIVTLESRVFLALFFSVCRGFVYSESCYFCSGLSFSGSREGSPSLFVVGYCPSVSLPQCVSSPMCPFSSVSPPQCVPFPVCPLSSMFPPQFVPSQVCPFPQCVPSLVCPLPSVSHPKYVPFPSVSPS